MDQAHLLRLRPGLEIHRVGVMLFIMGLSYVLVSMIGGHPPRSWSLFVALSLGPLVGLLGTLTILQYGLTKVWDFLVSGLLCAGGLYCVFTGEAGMTFLGMALWLLSAFLVLSHAERLSQELGAPPHTGAVWVLVIPVIVATLLVFLGTSSRSETLMFCGLALFFFTILAFGLVYSMAIGRATRRIDELGENRESRLEL